MCKSDVTSKLDYLNPPEIKIIESGYVNLDKKWKSDTISSAFSCLYIVESGEGELICNGRKIVMKKNKAYLIPAETAVSYSCKNKLTKLFVHINMIGEDGFDILRNLKEIKYCDISENRLEQLISLYKKNKISEALLFRSILTEYISNILDLYDNSLIERKKYSPLIKNTMNYIQENLSHDLDLYKLAKKHFVAEITLRNHFKSETGITPRKYIEDLVFFKAKILLWTTNLTIKEISIILGFKDQLYFTKRFKEINKFSPKVYRELNKKASKI